mmetsp:Transcript_26668/g.40492  ORF Transcript_26668/g.40492 Transcript_26668/m.40492 type:complete len:436 (-) Transcript_26668:63-1370(-)
MYSVATLVLSLLTFQAGAFDANSKAGQKLMNSARQLENNGERDVSWMPNYSIKFESCHSLVQVAGEENGGGEDGSSMLFTQHLIEFKLCPSGTCSTGCKNGGRYITNMREFTQMFIEYKEQEKEEKCESIRENCYNDDENYCFYQAGAQECIENENGDDEQNVEEYMECTELEMDNDNNNQNYNWNNNGGDNYMYRQYFVGPKCSNNGKSINLSLFLDAGCSVPAEDGVYEKISRGYSLPYAKESMISSECISCEQVDEDKYYNNNNNNNNHHHHHHNWTKPWDADPTIECIPQPQDVLCGRGKRAYTHPGNQQLQSAIAVQASEFTSCTSRAEKSFLVREVVGHVLENGGRFLKKDFERKDDDDYWYLASFHDAREKISHAFRNYCPTTTTTRRSNETKTTKSFSSSTTSTMDADNNFLSAVTGLCSLSQNVKG